MNPSTFYSLSQFLTGFILPRNVARRRGFTLTLRQAQGGSNSRAGFTLIELLIVIAIIAVLSVVVILTLNPAQLLKQARDATRLSDLGTINKAINIYQADVSGGSIGGGNTIYVSLPDSSPLCANLGLPAPPSGWAYKCVTQPNLRNVDGSGWIPVDFTKTSIRSPLGSLLVDPINTISSGYYYTYLSGGSGWELTTIFESQKYLWNILRDGGSDSFRYEVGSNLALSGQALGTEILANGGMETGTGGLADSWQNVVGGGGTITPADAEQTNIISGVRSQKLTIVTGAGGSGLRQSVTLVCNSWYRVRAFYKSGISGGTPTFIGVYDISGGGQSDFFPSISMTNDNTLHNVEAVSQVPSNCAGTGYVDVPRTNAGYTGSIYIDEVSVRKIQ